MLPQYSKDFREEAIKLSDEIGVRQAAEDLGVKYTTLTGWRTLRNKKRESKGKELSEAEKEEQIQILKRENTELKRVNAILKEAISFFVVDRKK